MRTFTVCISSPFRWVYLDDDKVLVTQSPVEYGLQEIAHLIECKVEMVDFAFQDFIKAMDGPAKLSEFRRIKGECDRGRALTEIRRMRSEINHLKYLFNIQE